MKTAAAAAAAAVLKTAAEAAGVVLESGDAGGSGMTTTPAAAVLKAATGGWCRLPADGGWYSNSRRELGLNVFPETVQTLVESLTWACSQAGASGRLPLACLQADGGPVASTVSSCTPPVLPCVPPPPPSGPGTVPSQPPVDPDPTYHPSPADSPLLSDSD